MGSHCFLFVAGLLDAFKKNKYLYVLVLSLVTTVVLINETLDFSGKIMENKMLIIFSLLVFVFLFSIAVNSRIWVIK